MTAGLEVDPVERQAIAAQVNLSVFRRSDPAVTAIIASASHVVLYQLNDGSEWCRRNVEGGLFLVERRLKPDHIVYRLVIVNRKSPDNYEDDLRVGNEDLELNDHMLMYHNSAGHIVGIWFYQSHEADRVYAMFRDILRGIHPAPEIAKSKGVVHIDDDKQPAPDTSLERFFPNLKLTNGVAGGKMPSNAKELGAVESEAASGNRSTSNTEMTAFKPTAEIDGAIVTASETPASDVVVGELITAANIALASSQPLTSTQIMGQETGQTEQVVELPKTSIVQKGNQGQRNAQKQGQKGGTKWTGQQKNARRARGSPPQNKRKPGPQEGQEQQRYGQMGKQGGQVKQLGQSKVSQGVEGNRGGHGGHVSKSGQTGQGSRWQRRGQKPSPVEGGQIEEKREEVDGNLIEMKKEESKAELERKEVKEETKGEGANSNEGANSGRGDEAKINYDGVQQLQPAMGQAQVTHTQAMYTQALQKQAMYTQAVHTQTMQSQEMRTRAQNIHAQNMQAQNLQEVRYREMHGFGGPGGGDMGNGANGMVGGRMGVGGGARHYGGAGMPAPMTMMMHASMPYQMYMQQQQYLANVHQQMQAQSLSASQQQQQRHFEVVGGARPGVHGIGSNRSGETSGRRIGEMNENEEAGKGIGRGIVKAEHEGMVGPGGTQLDREGFRAVVQRMLTDRKLFDYVYEHYAESWK